MKFVIIINGKGGVGKDTICNIVSKYYKTKNISSIDPIKKIATLGGWDGNKDNNGRLLLSNIKKAFVNYNDLPTKYLLAEYKKFLQDNELEILFVHIREPEEIIKFKSKIAKDTDKVNCYTLLIKSKNNNYSYNNSADNSVDNYHYDFVYKNVETLDKVEESFMQYFNKFIIEREIYNG